MSVVHAIRRSPRRELVKFVLVGVSNTLVTFTVYSALVALGVWYLAASAVGIAVGMVNGYTWNRVWTFRSGPHRNEMLVKYVLVSTAGMLVSAACLSLLVESLRVSEVPAQALALPLVALVTYSGNRRWTFA